MSHPKQKNLDHDTQSSLGHKRGHISRIALIYLGFLALYSPLRRECRMFSAALYARVRFLYPICTRDRGCSAHPAFPAPSLLSRDNFMHNSDALRRGIVYACLELAV